MRRWIIGQHYPLLEGDPGKGGNGTGVDIEATVQRLLDSKGDRAAVGELLRDNFRQREEIRSLKEKLDKAQKMADDGLILSADEAKAWKAYQELGKPEDVKKSLDTKKELEQKVQAAEHADGRRAAAATLGWKDSVLAELKGADKLKFEVREEMVDGEKVNVAYVIDTSVQGATPKKLTDHADAAWKDFLPALQADADNEKAGRPGAGGAGASLPRMKADGTPPKKGPATVEDIAETKRAARDYASF